MRAKRSAVNTSALDLVHYSNKDDESFVVNFSDEAYIDQDFTSNINKLRDGLTHIDSKGGTALYDAIMASADYLTKNAKRAKQVLLVITDGEDNASSTTLEETVRRIQDLQGPVVYTIGLLYDDTGGGREARRAKRALEMLSNETGGISFFPKNLEQVDEIAGEVARDIREQYTIGYHSTKAASLGGFRTVHVEAKAKGYNKLIVRTKTGYYPNTKGKTAPATVPVSEPHASN
jgi:VWFA-related protein